MTAGVFLLPLLPGESRKVAGDTTIPVIAHRMCCVVMARGDLLVAVVKGDCSERRIDQTFRQRPQFRDFATAAPHAFDAAVRGTKHAAVGRHFLHLRLTMSDMTDRSRMPDGLGDRFRAAFKAAVEMADVKHRRQIRLFRNESLGVETGEC